MPQYNLPTQISQLDPNITFVSFKEVDGFSCAVFNSSEGNVYAVRLSDLTRKRYNGADLYASDSSSGSLFGRAATAHPCLPDWWWRKQLDLG